MEVRRLRVYEYERMVKDERDLTLRIHIWAALVCTVVVGAILWTFL